SPLAKLGEPRDAEDLVADTSSVDVPSRELEPVEELRPISVGPRASTCEPAPLVCDELAEALDVRGLTDARRAVVDDADNNLPRASIDMRHSPSSSETGRTR